MQIEIDWSSVRTLAITVGVREAARRLGISEDAALKRSQREGWLADPQARQVAARSVQERSYSALSSAVITPAQAIQNELVGLGSRSRIALARGLGKAARCVENMKGKQVLEAAPNVKQTVQSLALVHGWQDQAPAAGLRLTLTANITAEEQPPTIDVEGVEVEVDARI
jgi:hypothetical protein